MEGITEIEELNVAGNPDSYLVAFTSDRLDILGIDDIMADKGWVTSQLNRPPAIHLFLDRSNAMSIDSYLSDLGDATAAYRAGKRGNQRDRHVYTR